MLGIGLGKLFLLVLLILVIWYGFKFVNRAEQVRQTFQRAAREAAERGQARNQARDQRRARTRRGETAIKAEDIDTNAAQQALQAAHAPATTPEAQDERLKEQERARGQIRVAERAAGGEREIV